MPHANAETRQRWRNQPEVRERIREADRRYYRTRRVNSIERRRQILAQYSCLSCGESDPCTIDWHHIDESEKLFNIATGMTRGEDSWWDEVCKCVPLCANCHRKLHNNKLCLIPVSLTG